VTKQVSVQEPDGTNLVIARPNILDASKGIMGTTFTTNSSMSLTLKISLYTTAGELVKVVQGDSGSGTAYLGASGLASGIYIAVVEVKDSQDRLVSRQTLKVLVRH
jgi:hypothetical protein